MSRARLFATVVTLFVVLCFPAFEASAQQKETPPEGGAPKPFHSPERQMFSMPNGLRVTLVRYGLIPKCAIRLVLNGGAIAEPEHQEGVASLMGELLKQGTVTRPAAQIAQDAADVGGEITIRAGADQIVLSGESLSSGAGSFIRLLADVTLHPKFPESELPRIKKDLLRSLAIMRSTPRVMAAQEFSKIVYGDNGYGRVVPSDADIQSATMADIKAYYSRIFVASGARLYAAGVFDSNLRAVIEDAFSSWPKGTPVELPAIKAQTRHTVAVVNRPGAAQSTIYMGLPVATPRNKDYIPLDVTNAILGGSFMSRITSNIREQKGYTYSPRSFIEDNLEDSVWAERADVTTKFTGASLTEIFGEINKLRTQAPPGKELRGIQNGLTGAFVLSNSSRRGIISMINFVDDYQLPADYLDTYIPKVYAVKPPDVQGMMEKYLDPEKMTVVVVGDKKEIDGQLAPFKAAR